MNRASFLLIIAFLSVQIYAQLNPGARQVGMSNSEAALSDDVFSIFNNPSGLAQMNWREIGIYYSPAPFSLPELENGFIAYNEPTSFGNIAAGVQTFGFELFRETKLLLGYSTKLGNKFFLGGALNMQTVSIKNYGSDFVFCLNLGALFYIINELRFGISILNINRATYGKEEGQIPTSLNSGFSFNPIDELTLNFAFSKDIDYPIEGRFGLEYDLVEYLSLRFGSNIWGHKKESQTRFSTGIGIIYSIFQFDYSLFTHDELGTTHQFGALISFGKEKSRSKKIKEYLNIR